MRYEKISKIKTTIYSGRSKSKHTKNKGRNAENFSPIEQTSGICRLRDKVFFLLKTPAVDPVLLLLAVMKGTGAGAKPAPEPKGRRRFRSWLGQNDKVPVPVPHHCR